MLKSNQMRAARALLRWPARELAARASVHITTVQRMERGTGPVNGTARVVFKIQAALEAAGIEFLSSNGGSGVHLKGPE